MFCYEKLFAWILCHTSVNSTKSVLISTLPILWIKALCKYWPWFKKVSALETMELSSGLTCQQKSAGSPVKLGRENAAVAPVPSLLPACLSQTAAFSQPRLPGLSATAPRFPLTHLGQPATRPWGADKQPLKTLLTDRRGTTTHAVTAYLQLTWHSVNKPREKGKAGKVLCIGTVCRHAESHSFERSLSLPEMILRKYLKCISWLFQIRHQRKRLAASLHLISKWELCASGLCTGWHYSLRKRANTARAFFRMCCENPARCRDGSVQKQSWQSTLPAAPSEVYMSRCPVSTDGLFSFWAENVTFCWKRLSDLVKSSLIVALDLTDKLVVTMPFSL